MRRPEQALQKQVAEYLDRTLLPEVVWSAIGHGGGGRTRGAILKGMGMKAGLPDILIWWRDVVSGHGYCMGIELKSAKGTLSKAQKQMRARLRWVGVYLYTCRSFDDVRFAINESGIQSRDTFMDLRRRAA